MTNTTLPFGPSEIQADLPPRARFVGGGGAAVLPPVPDEDQAIRRALSDPLGLPPIRELVRPGARILIAFDDPTLPSYGPVRALAIEAVLEELAEAGVAEENVTLVCANALHRKWTRQELSSILSESLVERFGERLFCHDAEDEDNLVHLGVTASGYDVEVHRLVVDSDLTIYVNAVCTLGFGGGWKSICVGLSTWRSIRHTHTPDGMTMSIRKNRMHAVFDEMGHHLEEKLGRRVFKLETVLSDPFRIARVWAGGVDEARAAALELQASVHSPRRDEAEPADVIVYGLPDYSPYARFATMNPILTLISSGLGYQGGYIQALGKEGCSVVLATPVPEQWDMDHHPAYKEVWERILVDHRDPYEITNLYGEEFASRRDYIDMYRFGVAFHPIHAILATHPLKRLRHAGRVFVAGAEDPAVPRHLGFTPTESVEEALAEAEGIHGRNCSIATVGAPAV